jgi:hypothetical protein
MTKAEIELRRKQLSAEFLALPNGWSSRGLEICEEFGQLADEEVNLKRTGSFDQLTEISKSEGRNR